MPENTGLYTVHALSIELGRDRSTLRRWMADVPSAGHDESGHALYTVEDARRAISRALQRRGGSQARERMLNLQCDKLQHQLAVMRGEFVAVKDVELWTGQMVGEAKRVLEAGPPSLAPQVVGVSIAEAEQLLRGWIHDALEQLHADPLGTSRTAPASAPEPAPRNTVTEVHDTTNP
jgi:hypothetical protein